MLIKEIIEAIKNPPAQTIFPLKKHFSKCDVQTQAREWQKMTKKIESLSFPEKIGLFFYLYQSKTTSIAILVPFFHNQIKPLFEQVTLLPTDWKQWLRCKSTTSHINDFMLAKFIPHLRECDIDTQMLLINNIIRLPRERFEKYWYTDVMLPIKKTLYSEELFNQVSKDDRVTIIKGWSNLLRSKIIKKDDSNELLKKLHAENKEGYKQLILQVIITEIQARSKRRKVRYESSQYKDMIKRLLEIDPLLIADLHIKSIPINEMYSLVHEELNELKELYSKENNKRARQDTPFRDDITDKDERKIRRTLNQGTEKAITTMIDMPYKDITQVTLATALVLAANAAQLPAQTGYNLSSTTSQQGTAPRRQVTFFQPTPSLPSAANSYSKLEHDATSIYLLRDSTPNVFSLELEQFEGWKDDNGVVPVKEDKLPDEEGDKHVYPIPVFFNNVTPSREQDTLSGAEDNFAVETDLAANNEESVTLDNGNVDKFFADVDWCSTPRRGM